jgi:hypothetical protein
MFICVKFYCKKLSCNFYSIHSIFRHIFGGFVSQQLKKSREYYGNGECFVFSVFPATKIYAWTKR